MKSKHWLLKTKTTKHIAQLQSANSAPIRTTFIQHMKKMSYSWGPLMFMCPQPITRKRTYGQWTHGWFRILCWAKVLVWTELLSVVVGLGLACVWFKWISSEWLSRFQRPYQQVVGHFGYGSFPSVTCTDNLTRTTNRQNTNKQKMQHNYRIIIITQHGHWVCVQ